MTEKSRVYIIGDIHGDFNNIRQFKDKTKFTKNDYVIILGDFGFVWYSQVDCEHRKDTQALYKLENDYDCNFIIVPGNHENYSAVESLYPVDNFNGAKARYIRKNIIWIERGEMFSLGDKSFWCFGGAYSLDRALRVPEMSWWAREEGNMIEQERGLALLDKDPDFILTHDAPNSICQRIYQNFFEPSETSQYLERVLYRLELSGHNFEWYFGHLHVDYDFQNFHGRYHKFDKVLEFDIERSELPQTIKV